MPMPMKRLFILLIFSGIFFISIDKVAAQETDRPARLFDSYGGVTSEDASARLDNFAIALISDPDMKGYLICYGPEGVGSGTAGFVIQSQVNYLVQTRGIDPQRINATNGGRFSKPSRIQTELWLIPNGSVPPQPKVYNGELKKFAGKFAEYKSWEYTGVGDECGCGPYLGNVSFAALSDLSHHQDDSLVYLVAYSFRSSPPGTWRRIAKRDAADLQSRGIQAERIKIIFGGVTKKAEDNVDERHALMQVWMLPNDAPPPAKEAEPERTPKKAFQIGTYNDYLLKDKEQERLIFAGFADVVQVDKNLNLYIITRPRIEPTEKISPDEPDDIDTQKLGEKWKSELVEKYGIDKNRIFVIKATADEFREGEIDVWVTPPGIPLPNTYSSDEDIQSDNG